MHSGKTTTIGRAGTQDTSMKGMYLDPSTGRVLSPYEHLTVAFEMYVGPTLLGKICVRATRFGMLNESTTTTLSSTVNNLGTTTNDASNAIGNDRMTCSQSPSSSNETSSKLLHQHTNNTEHGVNGYNSTTSTSTMNATKVDMPNTSMHVRSKNAATCNVNSSNHSNQPHTKQQGINGVNGSDHRNSGVDLKSGVEVARLDFEVKIPHESIY